MDSKKILKTLNRSKIKEAESIIQHNIEDKDAIFHLRETLDGELMELELDDLFSKIEEINRKHSRKVTSLSDFYNELEALGKPKRKKIVRRKRRKK